MLKLQSFEFELMPTGEQLRKIRQFAGCCRFVFNKALDLQKQNHQAGQKYISYVAMAKLLTQWRNDEETAWLMEAPCHSLQHALKNLDTAYKNFFAKCSDFPRFKRKQSGNSFRYPDSQQFKLDQPNHRIFLPKLGWVRYRNSREVLGELRNVTIKSSYDKWFMAIQTQREVEKPVPETTKSVGIDVGIARFATLSDGSHIEPIDSFKKHQRRLAKYQRRMSHKVKYSKNWIKAKKKVQKTHRDIAHVRKNFLHQATTKISKNHAIVCIEDLKVRDMTQSAKGTQEHPGQKVQQKSNLNRNILDQGWRTFRDQLKYKMEYTGGFLVPVPPHYTSQECPGCHHISANNRMSQSKFECLACHYVAHADHVGAINILERGLRLLACGDVALKLLDEAGTHRSALA